MSTYYTENEGGEFRKTPFHLQRSKLLKQIKKAVLLDNDTIIIRVRDKIIIAHSILMCNGSKFIVTWHKKHFMHQPNFKQLMRYLKHVKSI